MHMYDRGLLEVFRDSSRLAGNACCLSSALLLLTVVCVQAERERVENLTSYEHTPIVVRDIQKVYPAQDGGKPKMAVQSLTLGIERGECFGLLGPNGAGKV